MPGMLQPKRDLVWLDENNVRVTVYTLTGGNPVTHDMKFTQKQWDYWQAGANIMVAFPHLNAAEREFLISGLDAEAWKEMFPPSEDEE